MYARYFTSTGNFQNVAGYSSPELDALFAEGRESSDPAIREGISNDITAQLEDNARVGVAVRGGLVHGDRRECDRGSHPLADGLLQNLAVTSISG